MVNPHPFNVQTDVSPEWIESFEPFWPRDDADRHVFVDEYAAETLGAVMDAEQAQRIAPALYPLDPDRLIMTVGHDRIHGGALPIVMELTNDHALPGLPRETTWWSDAAQDIISVTFLPGDLKWTCLSPVRVGDFVLEEEQVHTLVAGVIRDGVSSALLREVSRRMTTTVRLRVGQAALRTWCTTMGKAADAWLLDIASTLAPETTLHAIGRGCPTWDQHSFFQVIQAIEYLSRLDAPQVVPYLQNIYEQHPYQSARAAALGELYRLSNTQDLDVDDYVDQAVTRLGFDTTGRKELSYGERHFAVVVSPDASVSARQCDESGRPTGRVYTNLPTPRVDDEAEKVAAARTDLKLTKTRLRKFAKEQSARFENLLIDRRVWHETALRRNVLGHPLLGQLLQGAVWHLHLREGNDAFARFDTMSFVDIDDEPVDHGDAVITLAHPCDMPAGAGARWKQAFVDHELHPLFPQLSRPVFSLPDVLEDPLLLPHLPTYDPLTRNRSDHLKAQGWQRISRPVAAHDPGRWRLWRACGLQVFLAAVPDDETKPWYEPGYTIQSVTVERWDGLYPPPCEPQAPQNRATVVPWSDVPASVISEVLYVLNQLGDLD